MNDLSGYLHYRTPDPLSDPLDALLADIAIRVQLPPGLHAKALQRNSSILEYLERDGSTLRGLITQFYVQGSMAIDATTSTQGTDDEFDVDSVIELAVPPGVAPALVLDLLFDALKDYPVKVSRQSRCVTLHYADGMHIDLTPSRRHPGTAAFESSIFHANPEQAAGSHYTVPMNAHGFAEWFKERTPPEERFAKAYHARMFEALHPGIAADAIVHDIPEQTPIERKSVTTVALQLIKRFRDIWSIGRSGRYPPSVILSCHAGLAAAPGMGLTDMVIRQARWTSRKIDRAADIGHLVDVRNPVMRDDCFSDRWPENHTQQRDFSAALKKLAQALETIRAEGMQIEDIKDFLRACFGPMVVSRSVDAMNERNGRAIGKCLHGYTRNGSLYIPAAPAIIGSSSPSSSVVAPRPHTNMGEGRLCEVL
jgi:hypothetical protein